MGMHRKNETEVLFFQAHRFVEKFVHEKDYDPMFMMDLLKSYIFSFSLMDLNDTLKEIVETLKKMQDPNTPEKPEPERHAGCRGPKLYYYHNKHRGY